MKLWPTKDNLENSIIAANFIVEKIKNYEKKKTKRNFTLMLPTGSTPIPMYGTLISLYHKGIISFKNVTIFNLDEYLELSPDHEQSYNFFIRHHFTDRIDIAQNNIHLFEMGNKTEEQIQDIIKMRDQKIKECGGIDLIVAGIGQNGHLAFNEPLSSFNSGTRIVDLCKDTISANSRFFSKKEDVPLKAISMGLLCFQQADTVLVLASGNSKAKAIQQMVEGSVTHMCPATILQGHENVIVICDKIACYGLLTSTYFSSLEEESKNINRYLC